MNNLMEADSNELKEFNIKHNETLNQFFVDTSTFALERWERDLGIQINNNKPEAFRRSVVKSKLRGSGTITVKLMQNVSESYSNGEVEVIEQNQDYYFIIKFVGTKGIPPNMDDLQKAIEEIKPAHLAVEYEFTYTTWGEVKNITWGEAKVGTWVQLRTRKVI